MTMRFEDTAFIPLVIDETTIVEEIECGTVCELDCNDEPHLTGIHLENLGGRAALRLSDESEGAAAMLWNSLKERAFEAVRDDVADRMREAGVEVGNDYAAERIDACLAGVGRWAASC